MNDIYFENVIRIGNLYLEKIFNKFEDENIIFVCKDNCDVRYLCLCYEFRSSLKWILCKISPKTLINLITKRIDIRSAFELESSELIRIEYKNNEEKSEIIRINNENEYILPRYGIFLKADQEIQKYLRFICLNFTETSSYKCERFVSYRLNKSKPALNSAIDYCDLKSNLVVSYNLYPIHKNKEKELSFINLNDAA